VWQGVQQRDEREQAMRQELQALILLDHPIVAKFFDWFVDLFQGIFFITEFCDGGCLESRFCALCVEPLQERVEHDGQLQTWFYQLVCALARANWGG